MNVRVDNKAGFCWGVVRTIDVAESALNTEPKQPLYSLGDIIHNPMEIERLRNKGLETITHVDLPKIKEGRVLIRAHGEPPTTYKLAKQLGIKLIDATCPVVSKVQERIRKFYEKGFQVVIYGRIDHAEVVGLVGQTNGSAIVIGAIDEISKIDVSKKTVLFSQTTMDKEMFYRVRDELKKRISELIVTGFEDEAIEFHAKDTICGQVSGRDKSLREFAKQNDIIIFVAGRNSSNAKVLFKICQEVNPHTYFVEQESELKPEWFNGINNVGITGATSTPKWLMERIKSYIENTLL